ncbi:MAG: hypothetical protein WC861_06885, partial [Candidatus Micrarchaeia archaeon]
MDVVCFDPNLSYRGGGQLALLQIARRFNAVIYTSSYDPKKAFKEFKEFDVRILETPINSLAESEKNPLARRVTDVFSRLDYLNQKMPVDYDALMVFHAPSEWLANRNPRVCWHCFSPARWVYDLYEYNKGCEQYGRFYLPLYMRGYRFMDARVVPKISTICPISETVNGRVKKYLKRDDAEVCYPGIDPKGFGCQGYEKFFFYPSRFSSMKRMEYAIEAFRKFKKSHGRGGWKLVLAGYAQNGIENEYIRQLASISDGNVQMLFNISR